MSDQKDQVVEIDQLCDDDTPNHQDGLDLEEIEENEVYLRQS